MKQYEFVICVMTPHMNCFMFHWTFVTIPGSVDTRQASVTSIASIVRTGQTKVRCIKDCNKCINRLLLIFTVNINTHM